MIIRKGFKYRLYPTKEQESLLLQHGGNARFLWNTLLKENMDYYKKTKKFKFGHEMTVSIPKKKVEYPFLTVSFSQSLQMVARQLDKALKDSFKKDKRFPKFKKKSLLNDSFTCPQKWRLGKGFVFIPKIGEVKWIKHRPLQGKPKSITISQEGEQWYCAVNCEVIIEDKEKTIDNIVGIDVGLKTFTTLSDGTQIENPKFTKKYEKKLAREQRRLSRKQKGSTNKDKQRMIVRAVHRKISNARNDFLHKTSSSIIKNCDGVVLEDLNIKGMVKNHCLAKSISDVSWSEFGRQLEYKSEWNNKYFAKVDRYYPSTKTCSTCGHIQNMPLEVRVFKCEKCLIELDRDKNASINIKKEGLNIIKNTDGQSGIYACGDCVSPIFDRQYSLKQEKEGLVN